MNSSASIKIDTVLSALHLPDSAMVNRRVPKKMLAENGAVVSADKRQLQEGIEELQWVAALKPNTIGIPEYRNDTREYIEIAVLSLFFRPGAKSGRITELIHRAIPYPVLLVSAQSDKIELSLAHKRNAQNEAGKVVMENSIKICPIVAHDQTSHFLESLALAAQPRAHLMAIYSGWIERIEAFQAAMHIGRFYLGETATDVSARREALVKVEHLKTEISGLRNRAKKETQMQRIVELNSRLKQLDEDLKKALGKL